jgi:mycothione reductase
MIVLGGGYIACELGYYFAKTGTKVDFLVRNRMLTAEDPDVQTEFEKVFSKNHKIHWKAVPTKVHYDGSMFTVTFSGVPGITELKAEALFVATGVTPNTDILKVSAAGVLTDHRGFIKVDE